MVCVIVIADTLPLTSLVRPHSLRLMSPNGPGAQLLAQDTPRPLQGAVRGLF